MTTAADRTATDPDRLAELEEERRFLLRSLADLEREYDAGDIDEVDYRALRDGYTVRAAATLRAIEAGKTALPDRPPTNWKRRFMVLGATLALTGVVWWALAAWSAQRLPGQTPTGLDPRDDRAQIVAQARAIQASDPAAAADLYALALEGEPDDVESLAYRGWTLALSTRQMADPEQITETLIDAADSLGRAIEVDPSYPDSHCFLGIIQTSFLGSSDDGRPYLETCLDANPPADVRGLVENLLNR